MRDKPSSIRAPDALHARRRPIPTAFKCRRESLLAVDEGVQGIVDELRRRGELDNTLIVFTSDNGFFLGQHRIRSGKIRHYEDASRVPLLMRGPGVPRGATVRKQVANIDLAATILDAGRARARPRAGSTGVSLLDASPTGVSRTATSCSRTGPTWPPPCSTTGRSAPRATSSCSTPTASASCTTSGADPAELRSVHGVRRYDRVERTLAKKLRRLRDCKGAGCG